MQNPPRSWIKSGSERKRFIAFQVMIAVCAMSLFGRLIWIQLFDGLGLSYYADKGGKSQIVIPARRGTIYDRKGQPLSENLGDYVSLSVNRSQLLSPDRLIKDLSRVTGRDDSYYKSHLSSRNNYITLARKVSHVQAMKLKELGWGLIEEIDVRRGYPYHDIAGQLLGFTDVDSRGISGLEYTFERVLKGEPGWRKVEVDVFGNPQIRQKLPYQPAIDGSDVVLTIDIAVQTILYEELCSAMKKYKAKAAHGIVLDPSTAEVLGIASIPSYDPNNPHLSPVRNQKNPTLSDIYEPGSTFKLATAAILLEKGLIDKEVLINTSPGYIEVYDHRINDNKDYGVLSFENAIVKSSNVAMIKFSKPLESKDIYDNIKQFGLLDKTDIELPGESVGMLQDVDKWSGLTKPNVVIGQGVAVTMLSMTMFYQMIANNGVLLKPSIIYGIKHPDGSVDVAEAQPGRNVLSDTTTSVLNSILNKVVNEGTGMKARIEGVNVSGKTGTSQKPDFQKGGYTDDDYWASFVGYFPSEDPQCLIMIMLDEPKNGYHGGSVAAPVFKKTADRIIELNPDLKKGVTAVLDNTFQDVQLQDYANKTREEIENESLICKFEPEYYGKGSVVLDQFPLPGVSVKTGSKVKFTMGPNESIVEGRIVVPVLRDLSIRDAIKKGSKVGLSVRPKGSGRVYSQSLKAGAIVSVGDACEIIARQ